MKPGIRMQNGFLSEPISKVLVGRKRFSLDLEETYENSERRVKMRDLESVFRAEAQARRGGSYTTMDSGKVCNTKAVDVKLDVDASYKNYEDLKSSDYSECKSSVSLANRKVPNSKVVDVKLDVDVAYKTCEDLKSRDDSECKSSVIPANGKDSMRVWEGLKQNNFMSTLSKNVQVQIQMPKTKGRKKHGTNNVMTKKTTGVVKKEHVDRFSLLAPPSGLLDGINPGIINSVRNSKQVHSVIVALMNLERSEIRHSKTFSHCNEKEVNDRHVMNLPSPVSPLFVDASCLSNEEPADSCSDFSLPVEAADVAYQWLELLSRDIGGRLEALRRSKKRLLSVITVDLPLLVSRELSSYPEKENVDAHAVKWSNLFEQMDKSLSEEENDLENWLNQVKELQFRSKSGLNRARLIVPDIRSGEVDNLGDDSAIMAAAGSIYSTCKYLSSMEN